MVTLVADAATGKKDAAARQHTALISLFKGRVKYIDEFSVGFPGLVFGLGRFEGSDFNKLTAAHTENKVIQVLVHRIK